MANDIVSTGSESTASAQPSIMHSQRPSFASVAARAPVSRILRTSSETPSKAEKPVISLPVQVAPVSAGSLPSDSLSPKLDESLSRLEIKDSQALVPDVPDHELQARGLHIRPRLDDEKTHLSFSSNKASSLDGKSVTSATTFAMDEKESIRPDDSASVKAAEDDDSNSGPASGTANSRVGSEAGGRAFGSQFNEVSERMASGIFRPAQSIRRPLPVIPGETTVSYPVQDNPSGPGVSRNEPGIASISPPAALLPMPDEKILEAMESPKDRLFLLSLEQQVISFIRDSTDPVLNLPPCNSFCRLLAHRLGDYYMLDHVLDNSQSAVQLHRTPHCHLRPLLTTFEAKISPVNGIHGALPSMTIMRRADLSVEGRGDGSGTNTTDNSLGPSKAASEADSDNQKTSGLASPAESTSTRDKAATREEREAKYKEARERIFGDWKENENTDLTQIEGDASRASSTSGKKNKKKKNNDDSFDSRSTYSAYYTSTSRQGPMYDQPTQPMNFYNPYIPQGGMPVFANGYQPAYGQQYTQPNHMQDYQMHAQPHVPMPMNPAMYTGTTNSHQQMQFGQQMSASFYQNLAHPDQMQMFSQPPPSVPSPASSNHSTQLSRPQSQMSDQGWGPSAYHNSYHNYVNPQQQYLGQMPQQPTTQINQPTVPYPFGQLPYQPNGQNSRPIHPIPGSYNRPSQAGVSLNRQPMDPNAFRSPSTNSTGGMLNIYNPSQNPQFTTGQQLASNLNSQQSSPRRPVGNIPRAHSPSQSSLSKWGTPANLPPKPPPPASNNIVAVGKAGGVPTFQNGTYSKPSSATADNNISNQPVPSQ